MASKEITMVSQEKFDELVSSTTKYLQLLIDKVEELKTRVEALETKKRGTKTDG